MDEPLSNLGKAEIGDQIISFVRRLMEPLSMLHDQTEAMTLGDRIVIMKDGFVQQVEHHRSV